MILRQWKAEILALALLIAIAIAAAQAPSTSTTSQRKTSTPYSGDLSIFDYPDRAQKLHIDQVMDLLGISVGKNVGDIGAGSGWFTMLAAKRVGPGAKVYAVDINPEAISFINKRAQKEGLSNVSTVAGSADNPNLPSEAVDAVLLLKTYHEVAKPVDLMRNLRAALRPGARVGIIDRNGNGENHGVSSKVVVSEMESAGYRLTGEHDDLVKDDKMDYFLVFVAR
jgi:SAM-dependent methyltransferase